MATLEKIRQKSVLLIVVIGVALLAFIIGDFLSSGRSLFGNDRTVATVGSEKIDVIDFQNRYNEATQQLNASAQNVDHAVIQQNVLNGMVEETLLNKATDELGIEVSSEELTEFMIGKNASYQVMQLAQQVGAESPTQLYDMISNPSNFGLNDDQIAPVRAQLMQMEQQMEKMLKYNKYQRLVAGALQANNLDKKALNSDNAIYNVNIVKKSFSELKDEDFPVSQAEIKDQYGKDKYMFQVSAETRRVNYIAVDIKPSDVDEQEGQKLFEDALAELKSTPGAASALANDQLVVKERTVTLARVTNPQIKDFLKEAAVEAVSDASHIDNTYSVTKLVGKKLETDSVTLNMVVVEGAVAYQDSILNQLNAGVALDDVAKSKGVTIAQKEQVINLMDVPAQEAEAKGKILAAGSEYFKLNGGDQGAVLCKVVKKVAPKQMYDIAEVSYKVVPSETTLQNLRDKLQSFVIKNTTAENFVNDAVPSGYQAVEVFLTNDMPQINGIKDSRKVVQWIFGADEGEVSTVIESEGSSKYIAAAVNEIIPEGYAKVDDKSVQMSLTAKIRAQKKADKYIADYAGKANDLNGYATLMNSKVDTTTVNFNQPFITMVGYEPELAGIVAGTKEGVVTGPVKGNTGVFVFTVNSVDNQGTQLSDAEAANRYSQRFGGVALTNARNGQSPLLLQILREANPVKNYLIKFY